MSILLLFTLPNDPSLFNLGVHEDDGVSVTSGEAHDVEGATCGIFASMACCRSTTNSRLCSFFCIKNFNNYCYQN